MSTAPQRIAGRAAHPEDLRGLRSKVDEWVHELARRTSRVHKKRKQHPGRHWLEQTYRAWARLWRYSVNNNILITQQFFDATMVYGRKDWAKQGRSVRPGAVPIMILAPSHKGGFPFVYVEVYDIKQTTGPPHPEADPPESEKLLPKVEAAAALLGFSLHEASLGGNSYSWGFLLGSIQNTRIELHQALSPHQRLETLLHEYAHGLLHLVTPDKRSPPHDIREAEAEAVSFVVLTALGLPSGAPDYLVDHIGSNPKLLFTSLHRIHRASRIILRAVIDHKAPRPHETRSAHKATGVAKP